MDNKIYLCSFASPDLSLSVKRFLAQSKAMEFYEEIKVFGLNDFSDALKRRIKELFKISFKGLELYF